MADTPSHMCAKTSTAIGLFLNIFPLGLPWYWGNLSVYVNSYIIARSRQSSGVVGPWLMAGFNIGCPLGSLVSGFMIQCCGKRLTTACGLVLSTSSFVFVYFTLGMNAVAMKMIVGMAFATGYFVMNGVVMVYCAEWANSDFGFMTSIAQAGSPAGAAVLNLLITFYVNLHNLTPDSSFGPLKYFSQDEVLDRVPSLFLVLSLIVVTICTVSILMVRENSEYRPPQLVDSTLADEAQIKSNTTVLEGRAGKCQNCKTCHDGGASCKTCGALDSKAMNNTKSVLSDSGKEFKQVQIESKTPQEMQAKFQGIKECSQVNVNLYGDRLVSFFQKQFLLPPTNRNQRLKESAKSEMQDTAVDAWNSHGSACQGAKKSIEDFIPEKQFEARPSKSKYNQSHEETLSWRQIIQTPLFGHYCVLGFIGDATYIVLSSYYKSYGQVYVKDDHFIANTSVAILIAMFISRTCWGKCLDCFGSKATFLVHFTSAGLSAMLFYFAPEINRWCYLIVTIIFAITGSNIYVLVVYTCYQTFGKSNLVKSFGLMHLPMTVGSTILSHLLEFILESRGWFWLFFVCLCWNVLGLMYTVIFLPA